VLWQRAGDEANESLLVSGWLVLGSGFKAGWHGERLVSALPHARLPARSTWHTAYMTWCTHAELDGIFQLHLAAIGVRRTQESDIYSDSEFLGCWCC